MKLVSILRITASIYFFLYFCCSIYLMLSLKEYVEYTNEGHYYFLAMTAMLSAIMSALFYHGYRSHKS